MTFHNNVCCSCREKARHTNWTRRCASSKIANNKTTNTDEEIKDIESKKGIH